MEICTKNSLFDICSPELEPLIMEQEAFWQMADFGLLDNFSMKSAKSTILDDLYRGVKPDLTAVKKKVVSLLKSPTHPGAYQESYPQIIK